MGSPYGNFEIYSKYGLDSLDFSSSDTTRGDGSDYDETSVILYCHDDWIGKCVLSYYASNQFSCVKRFEGYESCNSYYITNTGNY